MLGQIKKMLGSPFAKEFVYPLLLMSAFRTFVYDWLKVPTSSMAQTVHRSDFIIVRKFAYGYSPLSIMWGLGLRVLPKGCTLTNNRVPYIKLRSIQLGDVVCFVDPETGVNYTKRVVGLSDDTLEMVDDRLIRNGVECDSEYLGTTQYRSDYGITMTYNYYREKLAGIDVSYCVQYDPAYQKNVRKMQVPEAVTVKNWWGTQSLLRFAICGDNRSQSADSITNGENGVLAKFPCEACVIGNALGVIVSNHHRFQMHDMVSGVSTSWFQYLMAMPREFVLNCAASLQSLDRVFRRL